MKQGSWKDVSNDSHKFPFVEKSLSGLYPVLAQAKYAGVIGSIGPKQAGGIQNSAMATLAYIWY